MRIFQLVYVHIEGHGVCRREVFAEAVGVGVIEEQISTCNSSPYKPLLRHSVEGEPRKVALNILRFSYSFKGYDLAFSVSTSEYAEMSCANVWMSFLFCLEEKNMNENTQK